MKIDFSFHAFIPLSVMKDLYLFSFIYLYTILFIYLFFLLITDCLTKYLYALWHEEMVYDAL